MHQWFLGEIPDPVRSRRMNLRKQGRGEEEEEKKVGSSPGHGSGLLGNCKVVVIQALKTTLMLLQGLR